MNNERGGILSKIIIIPAGVVLLVGFFFLGYYAGKHQSRSAAPSENAQQLPEMSSRADQKQEEFTFYRTLTDNNEKMVSIDLKPKPANEERNAGKQPAAAEPRNANPVQSVSKEDRIELKIEKEASLMVKPGQAELKQPKTPAKKGSVFAPTGAKLRYVVQTASYQEKEIAEGDVKRLKKRGYAAFIVSSELPGKGMWHRVRLGSFSNRAAAEKLQKTLLTKEGISPIITSE